MRAINLLLLAGIIAFGGAVTAAPKKSAQAPAAGSPAGGAPAVKAIATVAEVMSAIVVPTSNTMFDLASSAPKKTEDWQILENNVLLLGEAGNLLMIGGRAKDDGEWTRWAVAMRDTSEAVLKAARAKNFEAASAASDAVYETCEGCHKIYLPGAGVN